MKLLGQRLLAALGILLLCNVSLVCAAVNTGFAADPGGRVNALSSQA